MPQLARDLALIGSDEAGYGPNLGPLVVGASGWLLKNAPIPEHALDAFAVGESAAIVPELPPTTKRKSSTKRRAALEATPTFFQLADAETSRARVAPEVVVPAGAKAGDAKAGAGEASLDVRSEDRSPYDAGLAKLNAALAPIADPKGAFPILDSKKLYGAAHSLASLERTVLIALDLIGEHAETARELLRRVAARDVSNDPDAAPPWERAPFPSLPVDPKSFDSRDALQDAAQKVDAFLAERDARLLKLAARRVQPIELNRFFESGSLKSDAIAEYTTSLLAETLDSTLRAAQFQPGDVAPCLALCDKLGGRNRYGDLLARRFPNANFRVACEARQSSVYRALVEYAIDRSGKTIRFPNVVALEVRFTAKGESNAPTALASICAKYLREVSMALFNDFWRDAAGDPNLAPTAGYPVDAARFRAEVGDAQRRLGIDDAVFWRSK